MPTKKNVTLAMSERQVTITLSKSLQEDFKSFLACCESLEVEPRINSFLYYVANYGTKEVMGLTVFNSRKVDTKKQPMFFGQPLGMQRYDEYKYPDFDRLTQQQLGYFWRPEEVSLQKDRADYKTLTDQQKHIYTSNLKYQILLDSVQGRGPWHGILSLL